MRVVHSVIRKDVFLNDKTHPHYGAAKWLDILLIAVLVIHLIHIYVYILQPVCRAISNLLSNLLCQIPKRTSEDVKEKIY